MARYAWATDVHLDHITDEALIKFGNKLIEQNPDGVLLSGDISNATKISYHLSVIEKIVQRPIYFVLGNHDFYGGTVEQVRKEMKDLSNISQYLKHVPSSPYSVLSPTTALVGHEGWYDALNGNWQRSRFSMSDWIYIGDFAFVSERGQNKEKIVEVARRLAHEGVTHIHDAIKAAVRYHKNIIVLTHVPPFAEAHIYKDKIGDDNAQPWFTSKMMGDMLLSAARAFPNVNFNVFAGHTHGPYEGKFANNLTVSVGGWPTNVQDYGNPIVQKIIDVL